MNLNTISRRRLGNVIIRVGSRGDIAPQEAWGHAVRASRAVADDAPNRPKTWAGGSSR